MISKDRDPRLINTLSGSSFESNKPSNMVAPGDEIISRAGFLERGTMGDCVQLLMPDDKDWTTFLVTAAHVACSSHPNRPGKCKLGFPEFQY